MDFDIDEVVVYLVITIALFVSFFTILCASYIIGCISYYHRDRFRSKSTSFIPFHPIVYISFVTGLLFMLSVVYYLPQSKIHFQQILPAQNPTSLLNTTSEIIAETSSIHEYHQHSDDKEMHHHDHHLAWPSLIGFVQIIFVFSTIFTERFY